MSQQTKGQRALEEIQLQFLIRSGDSPDARQQFYESVQPELLEELLEKQFPFLTQEERNKLRSQVGAATKDHAQQVPTKYQDPKTYHILTKLAGEIEDAAKELSLVVPIRPLLGTVPSGQVNASAVKVRDSGEYIVMLEDGIFVFALLLSKVLAKATPFIGHHEGSLRFSTQEEDIIRNITNNQEVVQRFFEVVVAYLVEGRPGAAPRYTQEYPYSAIADILRNSMELFIIGHEYGHIIAGHHNIVVPDSSMSTEQYDPVVRNWLQEFEADALGVSLMIEAMRKRGYDIPLAYWGADFFFSCIEIVERGLSVLLTGREPQSTEQDTTQFSYTHPPVVLRRAALRKGVLSSLTDNLQFPEEEARAPIELGITIQNVVEKLWEEIRPVMVELYENRYTPAPRWTSKHS